MANIFKNKKTQNIGTSLALVGSYTVPASTTTTVIGFSLCNKTSNTVTVSATVYDGTNDFYMISNSTLIAGSTLVLAGGDQKIVLGTGEGIRVSCSNTNSVDAIIQILELS